MGHSRGRSASPRPLYGDNRDQESMRNVPLRSRSRTPSRSYRSRSPTQSPTDSSYKHQPLASPDGTSSVSDSFKSAVSVTNLSINVREAHLRHIFAWYGKVVDVYVPPWTEDKQRLAYVILGNAQEAVKAALYMSNGQIDGVSVSVKTCAPPSDLPERRSSWKSAPRTGNNSRSRDQDKWDRRDSDRDTASEKRRSFDGGYRDAQSRRRSPPRQQYSRGPTWSNSTSQHHHRAPPQQTRPRSPAHRNRSRSPYQPVGRNSYYASRASPSYD